MTRLITTKEASLKVILEVISGEYIFISCTLTNPLAVKAELWLRSGCLLSVIVSSLPLGLSLIAVPMDSGHSAFGQFSPFVEACEQDETHQEDSKTRL